VHLVRRGGKGTVDSEKDKNFAAGNFSNFIRVDEIRDLKKFLNLSAADGGRRAIIVDAADEMNPQAANALLKMLEEPPARATLLLVSHQPSSLLPTIRSRCRTLRLGSLSPDDMARALQASGAEITGNPAALSELSGGSVGGALRLSLIGGLATYAELVALVDTLPRMDRARALKLSEAVSQRGAEARLALLFDLIDLLLARLARTGATGTPPEIEAAPNEAQILARLSPGPQQGRVWADVAQAISSRARHGLAVNLDPAALVLDTLLKLAHHAPRHQT
jgi:DNA polymerase-3 subunit delta'